MTRPGRNEPCHCGSAKKYKKCCQRKDEEELLQEKEEEKYGRDPQLGRSDPHASDEDWEDGPADHVRRENEFEGGGENDSLLDTVTTGKTVSRPEKNKLSDAEEGIIDAWWETYRQISDPDALRSYLENFMSSHPGLVSELDLESEALFELQGMYVRQNRHAEYIAVLSRLRSEFPEAYFKGFGYFDNDTIAWLVMNDRREEVKEYLADFRTYPADAPDNLFTVIHFLMSWNCQEILADFIPEIYREVCTSPMIVGGGEILIPLTTILMAPFLDQGLDGFNPESWPGT